MLESPLEKLPGLPGVEFSMKSEEGMALLGSPVLCGQGLSRRSTRDSLERTSELIK